MWAIKKLQTWIDIYQEIMCKFESTCKTTLMKSHFRMGALMYICCIFLEHVFLRTPLDGCFCNEDEQNQNSWIFNWFFFNVFKFQSNKV